MATSKEYAYYMKGNKVAIVQKDYTSSGGQTLSQPGLNDLGSVGALFWKSPKESITEVAPVTDEPLLTDEVDEEIPVIDETLVADEGEGLNIPFIPTVQAGDLQPPDEGPVEMIPLGDKVTEKDEFVGIEETNKGGLKSKDGKYKNVEGVSSTVSGAIKDIERMKVVYEQEAEGTNKKRLLLKRIVVEQQRIIDLIDPYISKKSGNFKNKDFKTTFYSRLSKKTKIPESELKGLILNNLQYNLS